MFLDNKLEDKTLNFTVTKVICYPNCIFKEHKEKATSGFTPSKYRAFASCYYCVYGIQKPSFVRRAEVQVLYTVS